MSKISTLTLMSAIRDFSSLAQLSRKKFPQADHVTFSLSWPVVGVVSIGHVIPSLQNRCYFFCVSQASAKQEASVKLESCAKHEASAKV